MRRVPLQVAPEPSTVPCWFPIESVIRVSVASPAGLLKL
jgi:hypothetical protein